jgi:TRAP transporter TAXI family solute receptor
VKKLCRTLTLTIVALLALAVSGTASLAATSPKTYTIGTSGPTGSNYIIGSAMANEINKASQAINISVLSTSGGSENILLAATGEQDFGFSNTDTIYNYLNGAGWVGPEDKVENIRGVMALHPSYGQWMALKSSNIHSIADLKGKRVCLGTPSISVSLQSTALLKHYGIDPDKDLARAEFLSQSEACDKLADGDLDAIYLMAAYPMAAYINLLVDDRYNMIDVPVDVLESIIKESFPAHRVGVIPAGTYPHIDEDIHTISSRAAIFCRAELPEDVAYEFCKQVLDNWDAIKLGHAVLTNLSFEVFPQCGIPLHPGAEKLYKERGLL